MCKKSIIFFVAKKTGFQLLVKDSMEACTGEPKPYSNQLFF